ANVLVVAATETDIVIGAHLRRQRHGREDVALISAFDRIAAKQLVSVVVADCDVEREDPGIQAEIDLVVVAGEVVVVAIEGGADRELDVLAATGTAARP